MSRHMGIPPKNKKKLRVNLVLVVYFFVNFVLGSSTDLSTFPASCFQVRFSGRFVQLG